MNEEIYDNQAEKYSLLSSDFFEVAEAWSNDSRRIKTYFICHLRKWIYAFLGAGLQLQENKMEVLRRNFII